MPAVTSGKVLVTGANGFIAVWLVKDLLEKGFSVRGTIRSAAKGEHLKKTFAQYGDKLELVLVDDITKVSAYNLPSYYITSQMLIAYPLSSGRRLRRGCQGCRCHPTHRFPLPFQRLSSRRAH